MSNPFENTSLFGITMNEEHFAEYQKHNCWFTASFFEELPEVDPNAPISSLWDDDILLMRRFFAIIFGAYGFRKDPDRVVRMCGLKIIMLEDHEPENKSFDNPEYIDWLHRYSQYCVIYGTALVYKNDYVGAALGIMNGLKTGAISLSLPYCDFIKYVLNKLEELPFEPYKGEGCGFSADDPMGGTVLNGGSLIPHVALDVIAALEGDKGGQIMAYKRNLSYGNIKRLGSTISDNFRNCIDIYEVLMIQDGKLKKLKLYFNGYFTDESIGKIKLPKGFHIDSNNPAAKLYEAVN